MRALGFEPVSISDSAIIIDRYKHVHWSFSTLHQVAMQWNLYVEIVPTPTIIILY